MYYALFADGCLLLLLSWAVSWKYRTVINPIVFFSGFYSVQTIISPALYATFGLSDDLRESAIVATVGYSALYFTCITVPFLLNRSPVYPWLKSATVYVLPRMPRPNIASYVAIALQFVVFFSVLVLASGTTAWLTDPRVAYQESRAGVGVWWSLCQATLILLVAAFLGAKKRSAVATLMICMVSASAAYFLGSKGFMLFPFVLALFLYQYTVRPIPGVALIASGVFFLTAMVALQFLQGTAATLLDSVSYFDYFSNTAHFLQDFGERFHYTWGETGMSYIWEYVPRGLYSGKPLIYGEAVIMEDYNPGAAEVGATPGILPWAAAYLDFGWPGVALNGLVTGFVARAAFDFLRRSGGPVAFIIFGQIGLIYAQVFFAAPFLAFWFWLAGEVAFLRLAEGMRVLIRERLRALGILKGTLQPQAQSP